MRKSFIACLAIALALVSAWALADGDGKPQSNKQADDSWLQRTGDFPKKSPKKKQVAPRSTIQEHSGEARSGDPRAEHKLTNEERQKALTDQSKKGSGQ
jgi:hypothetical protein